MSNLVHLKRLMNQARRELAPIVKDDLYATDAVRELLYEEIPTALAELERLTHPLREVAETPRSAPDTSWIAMEDLRGRRIDS